MDNTEKKGWSVDFMNEVYLLKLSPKLSKEDKQRSYSNLKCSIINNGSVNIFLRSKSLESHELHNLGKVRLPDIYIGMCTR